MPVIVTIVVIVKIRSPKSGLETGVAGLPRVGDARDALTSDSARAVHSTSHMDM